MPDAKETEFAQIANNIRHWERMRWVSMTVFMAIMAVSLNSYFTIQSKINQFNSYLLRIGELLIVLIFWVQDERIVAYWKAFKQRSHQVERDLQIAVFSTTPARGLFSAGTAVRVLYALFFIFWLAQLFF